MPASAGPGAAAVARIPVYAESDSPEESSRRLQEDRAGFLVRAFRQAGPIFSTWVEGESRVILAGLEANDFIWRGTELWDYPIVFPAFGEQMGPDHLNVLEGEAHRRKRTVLKAAFDREPALRFLPGFNACFHRELAAAGGRDPIDLVEFWAETITRANTETVVRAEVPPPALKRLVRWEREMLAGIFLGPARGEFYGREEYRGLRADAMALMDGIVADRLAHPGRDDDNFARVLDARRQQPGGLLDRDALIDDLYYIIVAGVENTSRLINWAALHCQFAPEWLARVQAELDPWDGRDVMALGRMPVLKAVVMETQRLRPPVFFVPRHAAREFEFGGHRVPAGTEVLHANTLGHFLAELYEDPFRFRPERFLEEGRFAPRSNGFFGGGVHLCLGRNHSLLQTPVALAQMFKYHAFEYTDAAALGPIVAAPGRMVPAELWARVGPRAP